MKYLNRQTGELEDLIMRAPGNYDADQVSLATGIEFKDPSLTKQSEAEQADINTIARNFGLTGHLPQVVNLPPSIEEFGDIFDMQDAMNLVARANQAFMQLPAEARSHFANDPHRFVNAVDDAYHGADEALRRLRRLELEQLGLKLPDPPPAAPTPPETPKT